MTPSLAPRPPGRPWRQEGTPGPQRPSEAVVAPWERLREAIRLAAGDRLTEKEVAAVEAAAEEFAAALIELFARPSWYRERDA